MISLFTNPSEMTSANALNRANKVLQSAMERLATGKRINSAADDAAGLQIATRLQGQSNGMTVAQQNISKASSMLQTAEGAFDEVTNILYRMKDLATQGADDTNGASDRDALQSEFTALNDELTNILKNTTYGSERLFSSAVSVKKPEKEVVPPAAESPTVPKDYSKPEDGYKFKIEILPTDSEKIIHYTVNYYLRDGTEGKVNFAPGIPGYDFINDYYRRGETTTDRAPWLDPSAASASSAELKSHSAPSGSPSIWIDTSTAPDLPAESDPASAPDPAPAAASDGPSVTIETQGKLTKALQFQIGAGKDEVMKLDLSEQINDVALAIGELGVAGHDLTTGASANSMIGRISDVLNSVGAIRSSLGASINRLGHTSNNLANMKDNTDNSIGVIRDTDYASESSQMTRQQMLAQSSQLMLRQAGSMSSMILNFLK
ncbi:Flagellin FlgL [Izhakiella capsodis]|uniref:Flagellin n=1 Tax=Izhakiella capsodis TaxID=1367852 RepID=A0A1I4YBI0_9GAMM|nr:flagellin [Izhakiella capsodis]SFN34939.1 Flagellin FlgL [Izhakiella capsodis]